MFRLLQYRAALIACAALLVATGCASAPALPPIGSPPTPDAQAVQRGALLAKAGDCQTGATTVRRVVSAVDSGEVVNPDGIRNQIEGAIVQSLSWTGLEAMGFDATHRTSFDWSAHPIVRLKDVPTSVEVHVLDRPGQPFLGSGEAGQGPAAAALANAIADATEVRPRDMPLSADRLKAAIGV